MSSTTIIAKRTDEQEYVIWQRRERKRRKDPDAFNPRIGGYVGFVKRIDGIEYRAGGRIVGSEGHVVYVQMEGASG